MNSNILGQAIGSRWAITLQGMESLQAIMLDQSMPAGEGQVLQAIAKEEGDWLKGSRDVEVRNGVAVMSIAGALFRFSGLMRWYSMRGYDALAKDFNAALKDSKVKAIVMDFDSPGGMVTGCSEFSDMIFEARKVKPVIAYVSGDCGSAAYWLACSCTQIVVSETAQLGSIGSMYNFVSTEKMDQAAGLERYSIVSTQSPLKLMDPKTSEGQAEWQRLADENAAIFISKIVRGRSVSEQTVLDDFGQGSVYLGQDAVNRGMADRIGSLEQVIQELQESETPDPASSGVFVSASKPTENQPMETSMTEEEKKAFAAALAKVTLDDLTAANPALVAQIGTAAVAADQKRFAAILKLEEAEGREKTALSLAMTTDMTAESAKAILASVPKGATEEQTPPKAAETPFHKAMASQGNPEVEDDLDESEESSQEDDINKALAKAKSVGLGNLIANKA